MPEPQPQPGKLPWPLIATFLLLSIAVGMGGYVYYLGQERRLLAEREEDLLAVADLKVSQLIRWRRERVGDAGVLSEDRDLGRQLEQALSRPSDQTVTAPIQRRLELLRKQDDYSGAILCDAQGSVRMAASELPANAMDCVELASQAVRRQSPFLSDFTSGAAGGVHLFSVAPIFGSPGKVVGVIVLVADPERDLYSLVQSWPTSSPTAETLLAERRGDEVVFLSHLRHRASEPLLFSQPLTRRDMASVQAVTGHEGVVSGVDYRGVLVLGAARRVPDTPWYVIAKIDRSEVQAPLRGSAFGTILVSMLFILCAGIAVVLLWRHQQFRFYRQQYEAESEHRARVARAEADLRRANRALRMLTNCNEALIRTSEEQPLLETLCRIVVEVGGYRLAWVGFAEDDEEKSVRLAAKAGWDQGYLEKAGVRWSDEPLGRTPMGTATRTGRPVLMRSTDIEHAGYRQFFEAGGMVAGAGFPLRVEGEVIGALAVNSAEPESFDKAEMEILEELADDLSFGIQTIRRRAALTATEAALRQSQKLESIGRLAGGLAHDFNNYLTVINGYCDVLLDSLPTEDPTREQVAEIRKSGGRAAELTERLLAFSRRQILAPKPCSLNDVVGDVENILRSAAGSQVETVLDLAPELWLVMVDPAQIHQVLLNLVINARDAMPSGGKLRVGTANVTLDHTALPPGVAAEAGEYVVLTVTDTGVGMDEETHSHLFEPFFTTKPPGQGTGLGLSTVYGIIRHSGGWISVRSELGRGTAFSVYFPRHKTSC